MDKIKNFKGIFFDLDGTLVDSKLNFQAMKEEIGMPIDHSILEYIDTLKTEAEKKRALDIVHQHELKGAKESELISGVQEFLELLKVKNIKTGILTRNSKECALISIEKHKLSFEHILSRDDFPPKPDPSALNFLKESYNLKDEECCYIGDYIFDIQAAKNAGMSAGLFLNSKNSSYIEEAWPAEADFVFESYSSISSLLDDRH